MDVNVLSESELEFLIKKGHINVIDVIQLLDHPEWKSFTPSFRSWVRSIIENGFIPNDA